jgi:hypothetical protein
MFADTLTVGDVLNVPVIAVNGPPPSEYSADETLAPPVVASLTSAVTAMGEFTLLGLGSAITLDEIGPAASAGTGHPATEPADAVSRKPVNR